MNDKFLVSANSLRSLAGKDDKLTSIDCSIEEYMTDIEVDDATLSVEIVTLYQYQYELAFAHVMTQAEHSATDVDDMAYMVEAILPNYAHIPPHVKVHSGEITVVVDCTKIDTQIVEYASQLLSTIPSLEPGFYWEYNQTEK